jgi:hypothetical protein
MTNLISLLDRAVVRRRITFFAGLAVMLMAVIHTWLPGEPIGSDWLGLALYLCGAAITVLAALPGLMAPVDRSRRAP